jgi:hypothetical protein
MSVAAKILILDPGSSPSVPLYMMTEGFVIYLKVNLIPSRYNFTPSFEGHVIF